MTFPFPSPFGFLPSRNTSFPVQLPIAAIISHFRSLGPAMPAGTPNGHVAPPVSFDEQQQHDNKLQCCFLTFFLHHHLVLFSSFLSFKLFCSVPARLDSICASPGTSRVPLSSSYPVASDNHMRLYSFETRFSGYGTFKSPLLLSSLINLHQHLLLFRPNPTQSDPLQVL